MRKLLLISMMIIAGFNLYSSNESFAREPVSAWPSQDGRLIEISAHLQWFDRLTIPACRQASLSNGSTGSPSRGKSKDCYRRKASLSGLRTSEALGEPVYKPAAS